MKSVPLYPSIPRAAIENILPEDVDPACEECSLHEHVHSVCMAPAAYKGEAGETLLIVGEFPTKEESRPFTSTLGMKVRNSVRKHWKGRFAFDYAIKCAPGTNLPKKRQDAFRKHVDPCRYYLADTVHQSKPDRVVAVGAYAAYALLGRSLIMPSVSRGYGFLSNGVPVFFVDGLKAIAGRGQFVEMQFLGDLQWALTATVPKLAGVGNHAWVVDELSAGGVARTVKEAPWATFDIETAGKMFDTDFEIISVSFSIPGNDDTWVWDRAALANPICEQALVEILSNVPLVAHNAKFDFLGLKLRFGDLPVQLHGDTALWRRLLQANVLARLEFAAELVGMGGHKAEADYHLKKAIANARLKSPAPVSDEAMKWIGKVKATKGEDSKAYAFGLLPDDVLTRYNGLDTLSTTKYAEHVQVKLRSKTKQWNVWEKLVKPALPAFVEIEHNGIKVDRGALTMFQKYLAQRKQVIRKHFDSWNDKGKVFNPNSHPQVRKILYERLGFCVTHHTDSGLPSTKAAVIEPMRGQHPFVENLLEWRSLDKLDGTYARGMEKFVRDDGRIHPTFKLDGTETGRLACEKPNGQNIPRPHTKEGKMARDIFVAPRGKKLFQFDFSQQEIRVGAILSEDPIMREIFLSGDDYHIRTAKMIAKMAWGIEPEEVEKKHRSGSKEVTFGLMYGKGDKQLAEDLGCSEAEAAAIRRAILGKLVKFNEWCNAQKYFAQNNGGVWIPWDDDSARWRPLPDILSSNKWKKNNAENSAINTPIQGRASDYCLASIPRLIRRLHEDCIPAKMVLTVHDSVLFEVDDWAVDELAEVGKEVMEAFDNTWGVPLVVDAEIGEQWGSLEPYDYDVAAENIAALEIDV